MNSKPGCSQPIHCNLHAMILEESFHSTFNIIGQVSCFTGQTDFNAFDLNVEMLDFHIVKEIEIFTQIFTVLQFLCSPESKVALKCHGPQGCSFFKALLNPQPTEASATLQLVMTAVKSLDR